MFLFSLFIYYYYYYYVSYSGGESDWTKDEKKCDKFAHTNNKLV